jgi:hypothetical protein
LRNHPLPVLLQIDVGGGDEDLDGHGGLLFSDGMPSCAV